MTIKRVVIVYNPRSSKAKKVEEEVIVPARRMKGLMVGKYGVLKTNVDDNAMRLSKILMDGDTVVAVGGDGTATIALNGIMLSQKSVSLSVLPYGNFNDLARAFKKHEGKTWYPLEMKINDQHYRYAGAYFTVGMMAQATEIFDGEKQREKLKQNGGGLVYSLFQLAKWYFKNSTTSIIEDEDAEIKMTLNGKKLPSDTTDYLAVNSGTVARIMRVEEQGLKKENFISATGRLGGFWRLSNFMLRSLKSIPGKKRKCDILEFSTPTEVEVQAEGEYKKLTNVKKIEVKKAKNGVAISKRLW